MKRLSYLILPVMLLWGQIALSQVGKIEQEFDNFYNSPKLGTNKCGVNIQLFLDHLKNKNIDLGSGYVVSVHEDFAHLNHFDARWGREESYPDGTIYNRSNWYFHVFLVLNGKAYDFSQKGEDGIPLKDYLLNSYLPKSETKNIILQGRLTSEKLLKKYLNMEMNIYHLDDYVKSLGPVFYKGSFSELFAFSSILTPSNPPKKNVQKIPEYSKNTYGNLLIGESKDFISYKENINKDGIEIYKNLNATFNNISYPIKAEGLEVCQSLGHLGTFPAYSAEKELETKLAPLVDLGTSVMPLKEGVVNAKEDVRMSFRYLSNNQHWNYKIMTKVGCGSLNTALQIL